MTRPTAAEREAKRATRELRELYGSDNGLYVTGVPGTCMEGAFLDACRRVERATLRRVTREIVSMLQGVHGEEYRRGINDALRALRPEGRKGK